MKFKDVTKMKKGEMDKKLLEIQFELLKLNAQVATGTNPKNPLQIRKLKKTIAKILTARNQDNASLGGTEKL
ncbi:50S ribosomal protein L29 [Candidatus Woesearchaeota archaeon]|nr:50S ribosomal protein L29 [Candidatus Woesearchaeota archaeon]|tara:strand:+ start:903 stop:1118 length:216 start_codon:yes stop_codon:yes gene_type:complete